MVPVAFTDTALNHAVSFNATPSVAAIQHGSDTRRTHSLRPESATMPLHLGNLHAALEASAYENMAALARDLGVSKATIGRWFNGTGEPETVERLKELATKLGTTMGHLAGEEEAARNNAEKLLLQAFRQLETTQGQAFIAAIAASAPEKKSQT